MSMLDEHGFDEWADSYDDATAESDEEQSYPFAGYGRVLDTIFARIVPVDSDGNPGFALSQDAASALHIQRAPRVLDLGFGTATLTSRLYESGCEIFGQDFSPRMIELAQAKMPNARLFRGDLRDGLVAELACETYDFVIATYALHHLSPDKRMELLNRVIESVRPGGALLAGDIAFATEAEMEAVKTEAGDSWDDEEFYLVAEDIRRYFPAATFTPISFCAGVFEIRRTASAWQ